MHSSLGVILASVGAKAVATVIYNSRINGI